MRRRLALLATSAALALGAAVVTAAPAEARNIGGFDSVCVPPGNAVVGPQGSGLGAPCICLIVLLPDRTIHVLAGPSGPGSQCPPGILSLYGGKR